MFQFSKKAIVLILFASIFTISSEASAGTYKSKAKAGQTTLVGGFYFYDQEGCTVLKLRKHEVKKEPKNGSLSIRPHIFTANKGRCKGKRFKGIGYFYRGNGNKDSFVVGVSTAKYTDGIGHRYFRETIKINH